MIFSAGNVRPQLINGLLGDPAVYVFHPRSGAALLLDLGNLEALSNRELLRARLALVSHTHIDHFIGFDRWLRVNVPHARILDVVGPPGLATNVHGKLAGYTWNLLDQDQVHWRVHEISTLGRVNSFVLRSGNGFTIEAWDGWDDHETRSGGGSPPGVTIAPICRAPVHFADFEIEAVALDHKTPSIAYALQRRNQFKIIPATIESLGWTPGPWLRSAQTALAQGNVDAIISDGYGRSLPVLDLLRAGVFQALAAKPLGFMTDVGFTPTNVERACMLFQGVECLICEANYRDSEAPRAIERMHLTTRQAALIAAKAQVRYLQIFHISNLYAHAAAEVEAEAQHFFTRFGRLSAADLSVELSKEFDRLCK